MVSLEHFRTLALTFPATEEKPHFEIPSFRHNGKIFATYHPKDNRAMLKLTPIQQSVYISYNSDIFSPATGAWGLAGATMVEIAKVRKDIFKEALTAAYEGVALKGKKK